MVLVDALLSVIAPHTCLNCGLEGKIICNRCIPDVFVNIPSRCYLCKRVSTEFAVCDKCKSATRPRHVWVRTHYDATAKTLLQCYKFKRVLSAVDAIAQVTLEVMPYFPRDTLVVPVPTATSRVRSRGYDHASLLARKLARLAGLEMSPAVVHISQSRQVGSSRQKRLTQLQNDLLVVRPRAVTGRKILIVDDVVTTGATLEAMTKVLKKSGAKSVNAVVFAQKQ